MSGDNAMEQQRRHSHGFWTGLSRYGSILHEFFRRAKQGDLVGPLFFYELVRLARRGRSFLLRGTYASMILGALCFAYADHFAGRDLWRLQGASSLHLQITRSQLSDFCRSFFFAFLIGQSAAVIAVTPVYLAGAIAEEKERQTLALLFASHLSDREIILSKLFARLTHLGSLLLTGLPIVLAVNWMIGSGDLSFLLSGFVVAAMSLLSAGSISILCSVLCRNSMNALMCSYGCLLAFNLIWIIPMLGFLSSPMAFVLMLYYRFRELEMPVSPAPRPALQAEQMILAETLLRTAAYVVVHGLIALFCIRVSIRCLRTAEPDPVFKTPAAKPRLVPISSAFDLPDQPLRYRDRSVRRSSLLPPPTGDPLLWKEMVHDPPKKITPTAQLLKANALWVLIFGAFWLFTLGYWLLKGEGEPPFITASLLLRGLGMTVAFVWCIGTAFRTASSLGRERHSGTLGMLLTLPVKRTVILRAKWLGGILRLRELGFVLLSVLSLGLLTGAFHPWAALLFAGMCLALLDFLASLGVWLALVCPKTRTAQMSMAVLLLAIFAGPWLQLLNFDISLSTDADDIWGHLWQIGLNPFAAWWISGFSWTEWRNALADDDNLFVARLRAVVQGIALLGTLAGMFWLAARSRLNSEPRD